MKFKTITLIAAIFSFLEIIRVLAISYVIPKVVEDWWSNIYVTLFNSILHLTFLASLSLFLISLYLNQSKK